MLAPAWSRSSWLTSREPREVCLALISPPLASLSGEAAPEEVLHHPPHEAWPLARVLNIFWRRWVVRGRWWSHAVGCRQARNLKNESEARRRNTRSITILLRQNSRRLRPTWVALTCRNRARSRASHSGPKASRNKIDAPN